MREDGAWPHVMCGRAKRCGRLIDGRRVQRVNIARIIIIMQTADALDGRGHTDVRRRSTNLTVARHCDGQNREAPVCVV